MRENRRAVLLAEVRSLAVHLCRIVQMPEGVDKRFVLHFFRIEFDLHHFGVAGLVGADIFVSWIFGVAVAVAYQRVHDSWNLAELYFDSPETAGGKCSKFSHGDWFLPVVLSDCSASWVRD